MDRLAVRAQIAVTMLLVTGSRVSVTRTVVICNHIVLARRNSLVRVLVSRLTPPSQFKSQLNLSQRTTLIPAN